MAPIFIKRYGSNNGDDEIIGRYNELYEFIIDQTNDDVVITYAGDNKNYVPAYMDFNGGRFNYGSWENAFFIKNTKPCVVSNTGKVSYYLNKNNYYNDVNGTDVKKDVTGGFGNCTMTEFPLIYWKVEHIENHVDKVRISDGKVDGDFECYANRNIYGEKINKFYVSAFESIVCYNSDIVSCADSGTFLIGTKTDTNINSIYKIDNKLRTKSGNSDRIWTMLKCCDKAIIDFLLILISKSIDCQASFGNGNVSGFSSGVSGKNAVRAGSMADKGMFIGYNTTSGKGVKVFGIENYWGNTSKCVRCFAYDKKNVYIKMMENELTKDTYTGAGEIDYDYKFNIDDIAGLQYARQMMIKKMHVGVFGFFPEEVIYASDNLYFKDAVYLNDFVYNEDNRYGIKNAGGSNNGFGHNGINTFGNNVRGNTTFNYNFLMSLKPRASVVNI